MLSISLVAEEVLKIKGFSITNSLLTTWLAIAVLSILSLVGMRRRSMVPRGLQLILEGVYIFFLNLCENILEHKNIARKTAPFIITIFLFVFMSNFLGLLPGVGSIGFFKPQQAVIPENAEAYETYQIIKDQKTQEEKFVPLFRAPSADLNTTIALALISFITIQTVGFRTLGFGYLKKFFNFSNPLNFFVGILELISEFVKIISFSFRLFGNIFAGEVLLAVILMLVPYFAPIPFYGLELFVALIQAFVFAILTLVFIKLATIGHETEKSH